MKDAQTMTATSHATSSHHAAVPQVLAGQVALVTGAIRGIGRACLLALASVPVC